MAVETKKPKDDPEQSRRFEEKARELGVDESGKLFDKAMRSLGNKRHAAKKKDRRT